MAEVLLPAMQCIWRKMQEQAVVAVRQLLTGKADDGMEDPAARAASTLLMMPTDAHRMLTTR